MEKANGRDDDLAVGIENEAVFYRLDQLRDVDQPPDLFQFEYSRHHNMSLFLDQVYRAGVGVQGAKTQREGGSPR
jgi:hypothetical protein